MVWVSIDKEYIVLCSNTRKANSIQIELNKNPLLEFGVYLQDNIIYFRLDFDNAGYHGEIDYEKIIKQIFKIDENAEIYSCSKTSVECSYGVYYDKYYYKNEIVMNEYQDTYIDEFCNEPIETIESYIVKHYLSMLDYVGNVLNADKYGNHRCKCLFCGKECEVYEDEKDKSDFRLEESDYSCYNCEDPIFNLDLIQLNMKKKNITYEESLNELFKEAVKKYLNVDNKEKSSALKKFRNIVKNDKYLLSKFDEYYNDYLNFDKNKKIEEEWQKKNDRNAYIKEEYNKLYKKIENKIYIELPDDANPFI